MGATAALKSKITLDSSAFSRGLRRNLSDAKAWAGHLAKVTASGLRGLARSGLEAGRSLGGALRRGLDAGIKGVAATAIAAGAGLAVGVKRAYDLGRSLRALSEQTGILPGRLLIMQRAFEDSDIEAEALGMSINKMQRQIEAAANGSETALDIFSKLKLNFAAMQQLSPDQQFMAVGRAIAAIQDPAERSAAAMEIFGKTGGRFLALFGTGGAMYSAALSLGRQAKLLDENSEIFDAVSVRFSRIGGKLQGFFVGVADKLAPVLLPMLDKLDKLDLSSAGQKFGDGLVRGAQAFVGAFKDPQTAVKIIVDGLTYGFLSAGNVLVAVLKAGRMYFQSGMMETIQGLGDVLLGVLTKAFETPISYLQAGIEAAIAKIPKSLSGVDEVGNAKEKWKQLTEQMTVLGQLQTKLQERQGKWGTPEWWRLQDKYDTLKSERDRIEPVAHGKLPTIEERMQRIRAAGLRIGADMMTGDQLIERGRESLIAGQSEAAKGISKIEVKDYLGAGKYGASAGKEFGSLANTGAPLLAKRIAPTPLLYGRFPISEYYHRQLIASYGARKANEILYGKDEAALMNRQLQRPVSEYYRRQLIAGYGSRMAAQILSTNGTLPFPVENKQPMMQGAMLGNGALRASGGLASPHLSGTGLTGDAYHVIRRGDHKREQLERQREAQRAQSLEGTNALLGDTNKKLDQILEVWKGN